MLKIPAAKFFLGFGLMIMLSACQTTSEGRTSSDVSGQSLGKTNWRTINRVESKVSIEGDDSIIVTRRAQSLPSRYQEALVFKGGGVIFFEELYSAEFSNSNQTQYIINNIGRPLKNFGLTITPKDIKDIKQFSKGSMQYAYKSDAQRNCFVMNGHVGVATHGLGNKHVFARVCQFKTTPFGKNLEANMIDLISRLEFDGGKINKAKGPSKTKTSMTPIASGDWRDLKVNWSSEPALTNGQILMTPNSSNEATLQVKFASSSVTCKGTAERPRNLVGKWSLDCSNGKSASGEFRTLGSGRGAKGTGRDSDGRLFDYEVSPRG